MIMSNVVSIPQAHRLNVRPHRVKPSPTRSGQSAIITFRTHKLLAVCQSIIAPKDDVDSYGFRVHYVGKIAHLSKRHPSGLRHVP